MSQRAPAAPPLESPALLRASAPASLLARALACALACALAGCGKKGPNMPPLRVLPSPPQGLSVRQIGGEVVLTARLPMQETDGRPVGPRAQVRILRMRATDTFRPGAVSSRYLMHQFENGAQALAAFSVEALEKAAPGGRLRFRDATALGGPAGVRPRFLYSVQILDSEKRRSPLPPPALIEVVPPPPAPHDLKVETAEGEVRLAWQPGASAASPAASGGAPPPPMFNVYRKGKTDTEDPDDPLNQKPLKETAYVDREFTYGESYRYVVRALAGAQKPPHESADSPEVEVRPTDIYPPKAPTGLAASAEGSVIKVYWFPNGEPDLGGYRIYRRDRPDGEFRLLAQVGPAETSFADTDVRPGVRYHYVVTAFDSSSPPNESVRSEERAETVPLEAAPGSGPSVTPGTSAVPGASPTPRASPAPSGTPAPRSRGLR